MKKINLMHYLLVCFFLVTVSACSRENTESLIDSDATGLQQDVKPPPVEGIGINAIFPTVAVRGETVTIVGTGFTADTKVSINGINCPVISSTYKQLYFTIPQNSAIVGGKITFQKGTSYFTPRMKIYIKDQWAPIYTENVFERPHSVSFVLNNHIYVGLGFSPPGMYSRDFHIYDPATNTWSQGPAIPEYVGSGSNGVAFVMNNKAYIGNMSNGFGNWYKYDPLAPAGTAAWSYGPSFPINYLDQYEGGTTFQLNNKQYVAFGGGVRGIYEFNPNGNGSWIQTLSSNLQIYGLTSFVVNNVAYVGGGNFAPSGEFNRWFYKFDPANPSVLPQGPHIPFPGLFNNVTSFSINNKGYVVSYGYTHRYLPDLNRWETLVNNTDYSIKYAHVINGRVYGVTTGGKVYEFPHEGL